jgi:hypothetical protein
MSLYSRIFTVASMGALFCAIARNARSDRATIAREVVLVDRVVPGRHGPVQQWRDIAKGARRVGVAENDGFWTIPNRGMISMLCVEPADGGGVERAD